MVKTKTKQRIFLIIFYSSLTILPPQLNKQENFKLMLALFFRGGTSKKKPPYLPPEDGFQKFKGGFLTLGLSSFQAFPSFQVRTVA
jgi:hypothetical protein